MSKVIVVGGKVLMDSSKVAFGPDCCCGPDYACLAPEWTLRYKDAQLLDWLDVYSDDPVNPGPTDCDVLCARYATRTTGYDFDLTEGEPDLVEDGYDRITHTGDLVWVLEVNPFVADSEQLTHSGSAVLKQERYVYQELTDDYAPNGDHVTINVDPSGSGLEWDWVRTEVDNDGTYTPAAVYGTAGESQLGAPSINTNLSLTGYGMPFPFSGNLVSASWSGTSGASTYDFSGDVDWVTGSFATTEVYSNEITPAYLAAQAPAHYATLSWTETGTHVHADRNMLHPTTNCGGETIERPNCLQTWSERIIGIRLEVPEAYEGTYLRVDWDLAYTDENETVTLTPASWTWEDPADKVGPWSSDIRVPGTGEGLIEIANVRYICEPEGMPIYDESFPTRTAT